MELILQRLRRALPTLSPAFDARALSKQIQLVLAAEDRVLGLGKDASSSNVESSRVRRPTCVRIPHELWRDASPRGALYHILKTYATWRREGWLSGDVDDTKGREQFESFARAVREELIEQRFMSYVKIYVPDDAEGASELKATARAMRATLASSPFEQGVTHVLRSDDSADDLVEESSMYRIVESSSAGSSAGKLEHRLHFWFYPDSYDQWYADSSISGRGKAPWSPETSDMLKRSGTSGSPRRVRARWLRDSFKFNEWMNELDYEFDVTRECLQGHRHAWDPSLEAKTKRQRDDTYEFDAESLLPEGAERMSHDVVRRRVSRAHPVVNAASSQDDGALVLMDEFEDVTKEFLAAKSLRVTNLSAGQLPASARPAHREKTNENVASLGTFRVPTHSAWFRWEDAHAVEEKALPELFTPQALDDDGREKYIECRNAMMRKFRDTGRNITLNEANSALKSESRVDNDTAGRIFSFLEDWGLLNWKFATEREVFDVKRRAPAGCPRIVTDDDGSLRVEEADASKAIASPLFDFGHIRATTPSGHHALAPENVALGEMSGQFERQSLDALFTTHRALRGVKLRFECDACGVNLIGGVFYHSTLLEDIDLCHACFSRGALPDEHASGDFVKALYPNFDEDEDESDAADENAEWSPQETAALLEAVARDADALNWVDIAASVGTKSEDECLKYFARMPIEDDAIESLEREIGAPRGVVVDADVGARLPDAESTPFASANNPTAKQLEFLVNTLSPRIASASAKETLAALAAATKAVDPRELNARGLAAAALQAKLLAQDEEHEIRRLVSSALDVLLKKLEIKMKFLSAVSESSARGRAVAVELRGQEARELEQLRRGKSPADARARELESAHATALERFRALERSEREPHGPAVEPSPAV